MYKVRADGSKSVVSAGVQTWNDDWATYRNYNAGSDTYLNQGDAPRPVWRLCQSYL